MNAFSFNLAKIDWDFFGTLTFRRVPNRGLRKKMIFHYLRLISRAHGSNDWKWKIRWAVRHEFGELNGRAHFHFLLRVPKEHDWKNNNIAHRKYLEHLWEEGICPKDGTSCSGFADVRNYDPSKAGAEYIMKADQGWFTSGANSYELRKFYFENMSSLDLPLLLAPSTLWDLAKRSTWGSGSNGRDKGVGLARFLRELKRVKDKSVKPQTSITAPERFIHPADPLHY